eukprot:Hpha_TRINITY_DN15071_c0_g1::TRINITY_DN15071_c0_g1_i4::g.125285::m.125285
MGDWDGGCDAVAKQELQMKQWLQQVESGYSKPGFGYDPAIFSRHEGEGSLGFIEPLAVHLRDPRSACVNIPELFWWDTPEANFTPPHPLPPVKRGGRDLPGEQKDFAASPFGVQSKRLADTTMSTKYLVMPWRPENLPSDRSFWRITVRRNLKPRRVFISEDTISTSQGGFCTSTQGRLVGLPTLCGEDTYLTTA